MLVCECVCGCLRECICVCMCVCGCGCVSRCGCGCLSVHACAYVRVHVRSLARIKRYCDEHPEKICIATGDSMQLKSIDCITNQHDYDEYFNKCVDLIFPWNMCLRENKRLKNPRDKETLRAFKRDIFDESIPIEATVRKYFRLVRHLKTKHNIAYRNTTCASVSTQVRGDLLGRKEPYEVGEVLVCRSWFRMKKEVFHVNYEYEITKVEGGIVHLGSGATLPLDLVKKNFTHAYCRTCHSFQGSSIDDAITIFDYKFVHVDRRWIYTSVTRATDLKKVFFYDYDEKREDEEQKLRYFQRKVERYRQQDKRAKRAIDEASYITKEVLMGWLGQACANCGDCLVYSRAHGKVDCNLSAQRVDCSEGHTVANVVPYCVYCNCSMSNRE